MSARGYARQSAKRLTNQVLHTRHLMGTQVRNPNPTRLPCSAWISEWMEPLGSLGANQLDDGCHGYRQRSTASRDAEEFDPIHLSTGH